jgi:uncharacterized membrane protein YoaK (UPF0700 family)
LRRILLIVPALASVAGFVDAVGYITLRGLFVAHMSGNSIKFGVRAGHGNLAAAAPVGIAVGLFIVGVALGTTIAEFAARRRISPIAAIVLAVQAALIAAFMLYGRTLIHGHQLRGHSLSGFYVLAALAIVSMGLQTSALRQLGGRTISTTYVTGLLTSLTQEATNYCFWLRDGARRDEGSSFLSRTLGLGSRRDSGGRIVLLGAVFLTYVTGGVLGSYCDSQIALWALLLPLAMLCSLIVIDLRHPLDL